MEKSAKMKFTTGTPVWDDVLCPDIEGFVSYIDVGPYPVVVQFIDSESRYTEDGRYDESFRPTLCTTPYTFELPKDN